MRFAPLFRCNNAEQRCWHYRYARGWFHQTISILSAVWRLLENVWHFQNRGRYIALRGMTKMHRCLTQAMVLKLCCCQIQQYSVVWNVRFIKGTITFDRFGSPSFQLCQQSIGTRNQFGIVVGLCTVKGDKRGNQVCAIAVKCLNQCVFKNMRVCR